jgi:hypothetical protein
MTHHVLKIIPDAPGFGSALPGPVHPGDTVWFLNEDTQVRSAEADAGLPCGFETPDIKPGKAWGTKIVCGPGLIPFHDRRLRHFREVLEVL